MTRSLPRLSRQPKNIRQKSMAPRVKTEVRKSTEPTRKTRSPNSQKPEYLHRTFRQLCAQRELRHEFHAGAAALWRHTKSLGTPRHFMKRSHAPLLCHDFHQTGGAELETVIGDTRGMPPSFTSTRRGGSELACLDQAHQDLTHIGLYLESQQCIGPCHALIDGHDGLALLMRCQRKTVTRIDHQ